MAASKQTLLYPWWPDGKHRSWKTVGPADQRMILQMLRNKASTEAVLKKFPNVSVGTIAAVRAVLNRR